MTAARAQDGSSPDPEPREILNLPQAAALLGVSTKTFQKVLREGELPGRKVGREWKFSRQALVDWVAAGRSRDFLDATDGIDPAGRTPNAPASRRRRRARRDDLRAEED